jgi:hypothetical protein
MLRVVDAMLLCIFCFCWLAYMLRVPPRSLPVQQDEYEDDKDQDDEHSKDRGYDSKD